MDFYDRLVHAGWIKRLHSEFSEEEIKALHEKYYQSDVLIELKSGSHVRICSRAHRLAESVFVLNGTKKEIHQALEYLLVCLDAGKYRLDWKKYREDHGIPSLEKKYLQEY